MKTLITKLFFLAFFAVIPAAHADTIPATQGWTAGGYGHDPNTYDSAQTACQAQINIQWPSNGYTACAVPTGPTSASCGKVDAGTCDTGSASASQNGVYTCPSGYTLNGTNCVQDAPPPEPCSTEPIGPVYGTGGMPSGNICNGGCQYSPGDICTALSDGLYYCSGGAGTGQACTGSEKSAFTPEEIADAEEGAPPQEPADCLSQGKSYITTNGETTCVSAGTAGSPGVTTQSTSTSTTGGSTTTTTNNTTVGNGTVTDVTTVQNGQNPPTTTTTTAPLQTYCSQNPSSPYCSGQTTNCPDCAKEVTLSNIKSLLESTPTGDPNATGQGIASNLDNLQQQAAYTNKLAIENWMANSGIKQFYEEKLLPLTPFNQASQGTTADCEYDGGEVLGTPFKLSICEAQPALHTALAFIFFLLTVIGILNLVTERPDTA